MNSNIKDKKEKIIENKETIRRDETQDLLAKIQKARIEIEKLNVEKVKDTKRCEKIKISKAEIINSIKQELSKVDVEMIVA